MATLNIKTAQKLLKDFRFTEFFTQELGWDHLHLQTRVLTVDGTTFTLAPVAQKRGFQVFECRFSGEIPVRAVRTKIDREVTKIAYEHLLVFVDAERKRQIWHWEQRDEGQPRVRREETFEPARHGGLRLAHKLSQLFISLQEEEAGGLSVAGVSSRVRSAFNVERVTKRFYDQFKKEHDIFLKQIAGIDDAEQKSWYASLMLNRLMFIYFIQQKGFLDGDTNYLRNRLVLMQERYGEDKFYSFYETFLLKLFHDGLGKPERNAELEALLGDVPYLNGGLFDGHVLENSLFNPPPPPSPSAATVSASSAAFLNISGKSRIDIPDKAFERVFSFFDAWEWRLDDRPLRNESEINPDVLGYIFEKYINQKQVGAYYTKEDITGYISKNTIIPFLFDRAQKLCANAFDARDGIWKLLREQPDRYIYDAVKHGITVDAREKPARQLSESIALPSAIAAGLNDVSERTEWNKTASLECGLPTETWREVVARRARYEEIHAKLVAGEVTQINDLITLNLDVRQFAQDVLATYEGSDLIAAFYRAIAGRIPEKSNEEFEQGLSVLDPTCGSGAFLFAALNVLEPLVETCIERMRSFVEEADRQGHTKAHPAFRRVLTEIAKHLNEEYFVLKSIIVGNLYGVDIMQEATEICKLRLFLKLVAHVECDARQKNMGLEPLPDIDFNIRAGNTLVGFVSLEEVKNALAAHLDFSAGETLRQIEEGAREADRAYKRFRQIQTVYDYKDETRSEFKGELRRRLDVLADSLNRYLAEVYGKDPHKQKEFEAWRRSHHPFHWLTEFYGIITSGGFNVIIGNPPYLEIREVEYETRGLASAETGAIHAMCIERSLQLLSQQGCISMIVPLALVSTQRMRIVQNMLEDGRSAWYSNYSWRPGKLFDTVNRALTIFFAEAVKDVETFSTNYQKWNSESRDYLMPCVSFTDVPRKRPAFWIPKVGDEIERALLSKCFRIKTTVQHFTGRTEHRIYYRTTGGLYWKVFTDFAPAFNVNGKKGSSTRETWFTLSKATMVKPLIAILSSDIFWWWYTLTSNLRDLNPYDVLNFPVPVSAVNDSHLAQLGHKYLKDLQRNSTMLVRNQRQTGRTETQSFKIQKSKHIIDEIDRALAMHYGFTDEELDFIINYDIKYRIGSTESEDE